MMLFCQKFIFKGRILNDFTFLRKVWFFFVEVIEATSINYGNCWFFDVNFLLFVTKNIFFIIWFYRSVIIDFVIGYLREFECWRWLIVVFWVFFNRVQTINEPFMTWFEDHVWFNWSFCWFKKVPKSCS